MRTFEYDDDNQLIRVSVPNLWTSEFVYDSLGRRRISRQFSGTNGIASFVTGVTTSTLRNDYSGWVGLRFTVGQYPLRVSELGRWVVSGNSSNHTVKIVTANGYDVPGAAVTVVTAGASAGEFKYATLAAPVTLAADTAYYLASQEVNGGDQWYAFQNVLTTTSVATVNNPAWAYNGSSSFTNVLHEGGSYVPVSFRYEQWHAAAETRYVYDGLLPIQELDGNNVPTVTYTRGLDLSGSMQGAGGIGGLLARTDNREPNPARAHAFYHSDGSGNVTMLINGHEIPVARYHYDPFGNTLAKAGPLAEANTYRFSSKEIHPASDLYYYGYRFYEPNLQRWLNQDPIGEAGGLNLYQFVYNNPVNAVDSFGRNAYFINAGGYGGHTSFVVDNPDGGVTAYHFYAKNHNTGAPWYKQCYGAVYDGVNIWSESSQSLLAYLASQASLHGDVSIVAMALGTTEDDALAINRLNQEIQDRDGFYSLICGVDCHSMSGNWLEDYAHGGSTISRSQLPTSPPVFVGGSLVQMPETIHRTPGFTTPSFP